MRHPPNGCGGIIVDVDDSGGGDGSVGCGYRSYWWRVNVLSSVGECRRRRDVDAIQLPGVPDAELDELLSEYVGEWDYIYMYSCVSATCGVYNVLLYIGQNHIVVLIEVAI